MQATACRWGIMGTATIARKNWDAMRHAGNAQLVAVASRSLERSRQFIAECQAQAPHPLEPEALGGYDELLARPDIDAVYIPLPTGLRKEWVLRAAAAKKHVLCEKPVASTAADAAEMIAACHEQGVQFMDGVMFMHSARLAALRQVINDGVSIGRLRRITTQFGFNAPQEFFQHNIRGSHHLEPLGCLGDLGWYNIRFALWVMNEQLPISVTGRILAQHGPGEVPVEFSGEMHFAGGVSASLYCSFQTEHEQWAYLSGTKGAVHLQDFVLPFSEHPVSFEINNPVFQVQGCQFDMQRFSRRCTVTERTNNGPAAQEANLFENFSRLVLDGQPDEVWSRRSLRTQLVLNACLTSARAGGVPIQLSHEPGGDSMLADPQPADLFESEDAVPLFR